MFKIMSSTRGNTRKTQKAADPTTPLGQPFLAGVVKEEAESVKLAKKFNIHKKFLMVRF